MWPSDSGLIESFDVLLVFLSQSVSAHQRQYFCLMSDVSVGKGLRKRKLCVGLILIPADSPHLSHLATFTSHSSLSSPCVCVCVWTQNGAFSAVSEQRHQDVFVRGGIWECVPQTNESGKKEKKRENGSVSVFWGAQDALCSMRADFYTADPEIPPLCVRTTATINLWAFWQWGVYWCYTKWREERFTVHTDRQTDREVEKERKGGTEWRQVSLKLLIFFCYYWH